MRKKQGLSTRELLEGVYNTFKRNGREVRLPKLAAALIDEDDDYHKQRRGYIGYESATLVKVGGKQWIMAFGLKCGGYPADAYDCDIVAVEFPSGRKPDEEASEIHKILSGNVFFRYSLIYAMADGKLITGENRLSKDERFNQSIFDFLRVKIKEFMYTQPIAPKSATLERHYKPEFVDFLYNVFHVVLT